MLLLIVYIQEDSSQVLELQLSLITIQMVSPSFCRQHNDQHMLCCATASALPLRGTMFMFAKHEDSGPLVHCNIEVLKIYVSAFSLCQQLL